MEYLTRVVAPPPTSPESKVVRSLMEAISETGTKAYCGGIGGGAQNALAQAGIKLFGGCSGNADQAVEALLEGQLNYDADVKCSHHDHEHGEGGHQCGNHGCGSHSCH